MNVERIRELVGKLPHEDEQHFRRLPTYVKEAIRGLREEVADEPLPRPAEPGRAAHRMRPA